MSTSPPATLGKYQIIREIARSNDIVYEGYDPAMNRRVAIKELNVPAGSTPQQREQRVMRFQREIKAAGSLAHPNIVTIYEVGEDRGRIFMAMEYLDGRNLRNELDTNGLLPIDRALEVTHAVLEALDFAHQNGVIHRDIKPDNIQILASGRIKLTDFGIARLTFEPNITIDGQVFGTPSYMSPEQVVGKELDARSDLFSVGAVLYEMITGQKAFPGDSVVSISYAIMNAEPAIPPSVNHTVQQLIRGLLDKSVAMRYGSAKDALAATKLAIESVVSGAQVLPSMLPPSQTGSYPSYPAYPPYPPQNSGQPPTAPQYTYGYQPPPQQPMGMPMPIYIPPPPRPPLFKAETKAAMARFFAIVVSLSIVLGVIVVGVQWMANAADRIGQSRAGSNTGTGGVSVSERDRADAAKYAESAVNLRARGDFRGTEEALLNAIRLDPLSPGYPAALGEVYGDYANLQPDPVEALEYWKKSSEQWDRASQLESDPGRKQRLRTGVAASLYNAAVKATEAGDRRTGRQLLYEAQKFAPEAGPEREAINALLRQIG